MIYAFIYLLFNLQAGETKWVRAPLADSYEHQIIEGQGALSILQYRQYFIDNNLILSHLEVEHDLQLFKNEEELKEWIGSEMARRLDEEGNERFVEDYFALIKEKGLLTFQGKIGFPRKQILVLLSK